MKDTRIRYNPAEREAVKARRARCFCSQSLTGEAMAARFLDNLDAIAQPALTTGPFIYAVHRNRIEALSIGSR